MESAPHKSEIKDGELIGRRVFDKKQATITLESLTYNVFFDTRLGDDLSVDRLGNGSATRSIVRQLTILADEAASQQSTMFCGWAAIHKKYLKYVTIRPDPISEKLEGIENPHHALIDRSGVREKTLAFHFSRSLLYSLKENGEIVLPERPPVALTSQASEA